MKISRVLTLCVCVCVIVFVALFSCHFDQVYEGVFHMARRDMKGAADLFLESLATFSATELHSYRDFIFYTVITALVSVDRPTLKDKVSSAPEILTVIHEIGLLQEFLNAVVGCDYKA